MAATVTQPVLPTPPKTEDAPNQWAVIEEFLKTVTTLAGALLGLTVTFATQLIGKADLKTFIVLIITWALSAITILGGVISHGSTLAYLRKGERQKAAIFFANGSFITL